MRNCLGSPLSTELLEKMQDRILDLRPGRGVGIDEFEMARGYDLQQMNVFTALFLLLNIVATERRRDDIVGGAMD
jgi:hypothetical protein